MRNRKYEQPKLELISLEIKGILLASGEETEGDLDTNYTVSLGNVSWSDIWSE